MVHIEPVPDQPPKEVPGAARRLVVRETEVVHLTRQHLHFVDPEAPDSQLTYTVTTPPFYTGSHRLERLSPSIQTYSIVCTHTHTHTHTYKQTA